ncbi:hypothetical protein H8E88_22435 [candidate division KSB1 bacterium]|nr:hypothetical protein [candidate division KSB1 bacterium]MBL7094902.1 hypothetical protein [candidate division KSB1 bacterium]
MKNTILTITIIITVLLPLITLSAGESNESTRGLWSQGTAHLLPKGRIEVGLFQPLRYGWSENLEFATHPLLNFLMPNLGAKWSHKPVAGFFISTRHSFYYPTPLLRVVSREGIGGMISPEFNIPHMISLYNEILFSKQITPNFLFTGKAGFAFALKSGNLDSRSTIDLPLIFPRLAIFYNGYGFRFGGDLKGKLFKRWFFLVDADLFYVPDENEGFAFEHKGLILWTKSARFQITVGYKLSYAEYPFGTQWHLLLPIFDFQWAWQLK